MRPGSKKRKENLGESLKPEFVGLPDACVKDGFFVKPLGSDKIKSDTIISFGWKRTITIVIFTVETHSVCP